MSIIQDIVDTVEKSFGKGSAMILSSKPRKVPILSTGVPQVDKALGVGGLPKGRIIEIYGPESSGKTTLALHIIAQAQKEGGIAAFVDVEHALDPKYAKALGVDINSLILSQPDSGEEALGITQTYIQTGECAVVVVDTVAALVPLAEIKGNIGDAHIGLQARLMGQALRKLTGVVSNTQTILIFINQIREKIGVKFGSPETTPGGRALKFYASVRIDVRRIGSEKEGSDDNAEIVGNKTKITIRKNKVAPPFKIAEAVLIFGKGFSVPHNFFPAALAVGLITKKKNTFSLNGEKLAVGKRKVVEVLESRYEKDELTEMLKTYMTNSSRINKLKRKVEKFSAKLEKLDEESDEYSRIEKKLNKAKKQLEELE